jgi:hypothetical protein
MRALWTIRFLSVRNGIIWKVKKKEVVFGFFQLFSSAWRRSRLVAINELIFPVLTSRYFWNSVWHIFLYNVLDTWTRLEHTPRKSQKILLQETGASKCSAKIATQLLKNAVFWDVAPCRSCVNRRFRVSYRLHLRGRKIRWLRTLVPRSRIFLPWRWRRYVPPKRRFIQDLHGAVSQNTAFFIVTAVKISNFTIAEA